MDMGPALPLPENVTWGASMAPVCYQEQSGSSHLRIVYSPAPTTEGVYPEPAGILVFHGNGPCPSAALGATTALTGETASGKFVR